MYGEDNTEKILVFFKLENYFSPPESKSIVCQYSKCAELGRTFEGLIFIYLITISRTTNLRNGIIPF